MNIILVEIFELSIYENQIEERMMSESFIHWYNVSISSMCVCLVYNRNQEEYSMLILYVHQYSPSSKELISIEYKLTLLFEKRKSFQT